MPENGLSQTASMSAEQRIILASLNRVRLRLFAVRLAERVAIALAWSAGIGVFLVGARFLNERFHWLALLVAVMPVVGGVWLWKRAGERRVLPAGVLRSGAILTMVMGVAGVVVLSMATEGQVAVWAFAAIPIWLFVAVAIGSVRPVDSRAAAIFVDQRVGLQERVSTALELLKEPAGSALEMAFRRPLIDSAVEACHRARTAKVQYGRVDGRVYAVAATVTLAAVAFSFLPPLTALARPANRPFLVVAEKGKKLETILKELAKDKPPQTDVATKKLQPLKDTLTQLKQGNMSPFEADARLNQEKADLQKEQDQMDASEKVQKALENIKGLEEMAKASEEVTKAGVKNPGEAGANGAERDKADQKMKAAADGVADKVKSGETNKDQLAKDLQGAADKAKGDPALQKSLQSAADDAKKGDAGNLSKDLASAGERMGEQGAQQQMTGQSLKDAMSAIDRANNNGMGSDEAAAQQNSGGQGGQQNGAGNEQANSGKNGEQQNSPQQGGQNGEQGGQQGGQNGQGGQQGASGQQGKSGGQSASGGNSGGQEESGGSTNLHTPGGPGEYHGGAVGGVKDFVRIYDQTVINTQGKTEKVSGKINTLAPAAGTADVFGQADQTNSTIQTYESQLPAARKRALDDLQTQQIPPQYRDFVRNYYEK